MPWKVLFVLTQAMHSLRAAERLQTAQGVALAIGQSFAEKGTTDAAFAAEFKRLRGEPTDG